MRADIDEALTREFAALYRERHGDRSETCMADGFPGDGWYELIRRMSEKLEPVCAATDLRCAQIKEKGGTLRIYLKSSEPIPDEVRAAVADAVEESRRTCEGCGAAGRPRKLRWRRTLCDSCAAFAEEWERRRFGDAPADDEWRELFRDESGRLLYFEDALRRWRSGAGTIESIQDYESALSELERLSDSGPGHSAATLTRLNLLGALVEAYEEEHFPIPPADPIAIAAMKLTIEFDVEEDGRHIAQVPELPGCLAYGITKEEADVRVRALALHILADQVTRGEREARDIASAAAVLGVPGVEGMSSEDAFWATDEDLWAQIQRSREDPHLVPHEEVRRRLGLPPADQDPHREAGAIETEEDYKRALTEIETLVDQDPPHGSEAAARLDSLGAIVEAYEGEHFPIPPPGEAKPIRVWLDDVRDAPGGWFRAYTAREAIALLEAGDVVEISLDHDLGDDERHGTGYTVACWVEEQMALHGFEPPTIRIHSASSVGRARMQRAIESIERLRHERPADQEEWGTDDDLQSQLQRARAPGRRKIPHEEVRRRLGISRRDVEDRYKPLLARRVPRENVVFGKAYVIHARNGGVGVAVEEDGRIGYQLHREKFGDHYLFTEFDWADDPNFGTAIPLSLIEAEPPTDDDALLEWLANQTNEHRAEIDAAWEVILGHPPSGPR